MPGAQPSSDTLMQEQTWLSWRLFWHSVFYVSLLIASGLTFTIQTYSWQELSLMIGEVLLLGAWYGACLFIPLPAFRRHRWRTAGYLSCGWVLWFALILQAPPYQFVLFGLYPLVFIALTFPSNLIGGGVLLVLSLIGQIALPGVGDLLAATFTLSSGVIGIGMMLFLQNTFSHNSKQADLIQQLIAARRDLAQAERLAGIMQERQRLAANIHDTVAQGFASIILSLENLRHPAIPPAESPPACDEQIRLALERIERTARESLAETRALLWALQPEAFERASLPEFLEALAARWSEVQGITAQTVITGNSIALRPEIEVTLLRAAQEALANVGKHAAASSVVLTLSYMDETVALDVQDSGSGFEVARLNHARAQVAGGFGLIALRERAEQQGGSLTIESEPGEGTTLALILPALTTNPGAPTDPVAVGVTSIGPERRNLHREEPAP